MSVKLADECTRISHGKVVAGVKNASTAGLEELVVTVLPKEMHEGYRRNWQELPGSSHYKEMKAPLSADIPLKKHT
jgi:hypothetical protein